MFVPTIEISTMNVKLKRQGSEEIKLKNANVKNVIKDCSNNYLLTLLQFNLFLATMKLPLFVLMETRNILMHVLPKMKVIFNLRKENVKFNVFALLSINLCVESMVKLMVIHVSLHVKKYKSTMKGNVNKNLFVVRMGLNIQVQKKHKKTKFLNFTMALVIY